MVVGGEAHEQGKAERPNAPRHSYIWLRYTSVQRTMGIWGVGISS